MVDKLTCGLCGTTLNNKYCSFCDINLEEKFISKDHERIGHYKNFKHLPDDHLIYSSTSELLGMETIDLLCLLRIARQRRGEVYKLRKLRHDAEKQVGLTEAVKKIDEDTYNEYEEATKKVWIIENIIKSRIGYYPLKVTDNFINMFLDRMNKSEAKKMIING